MKQQLHRKEIMPGDLARHSTNTAVQPLHPVQRRFCNTAASSAILLPGCSGAAQRLLQPAAASIALLMVGSCRCGCCAGWAAAAAVPRAAVHHVPVAAAAAGCLA
jgi:hypothetical protein